MNKRYKVCPLFWSDYGGEIPGFQEEYIRHAKEMLEIARKAVSE